MSDDTTTREAVERVLLPVFYERHLKGTEPFGFTEYKHLSSDALCYAWSAYADALRVRTRELAAERDDATTAERDRIRWAAVDAATQVMQGYADAYPVEVWPETPFSDAQAASVMRMMVPRIHSTLKAALADVARIINAEGV